MIHLTCPFEDERDIAKVKRMFPPHKREEWQEVVNLAQTSILIEAARRNKVIAGGPASAIARSLLIIQAGAEIGISPNPDEVIELSLDFIHDYNSGKFQNLTGKLPEEPQEDEDDV